MRATTTDRVGAFIQPGDEIVNSRAEVHDVFKVLHSGYGFAGVLLTHRTAANGNGERYALWIVSPEGDVRATMTTDDFPAVTGAFMARANGMVRENGTEGRAV